MMDLVIEDRSPISAVYFVMSEANIRKKIAQPWALRARAGLAQS